ncbi:nickel-dependent hydrogenase large subunit, partial [Ralstonia pseudosolanacearum]|uniref:nickel-dependent hydrogenase large subunit n=1 Tax=Ralstonia pseudosolanacearum TaxID=1310165 RepID=UPI003CE7E64F
PSEARGVGMTEAPRGALGHWIRIKDGRIENYQCVVPTTWNGSPRDVQGNIGAFEASLMNTPMERPDEPVEVLRTLHSFDPCLACSTQCACAKEGCHDRPHRPRHPLSPGGHA